jgi:hypothetical protein
MSQFDEEVPHPGRATAERTLSVETLPDQLTRILQRPDPVTDELRFESAVAE